MRVKLEALPGLHCGHVDLITVGSLGRHHPQVSTVERIAGSRRATQEVDDGAFGGAIGFF
jgi:hypothetical protein